MLYRKNRRKYLKTLNEILKQKHRLQKSIENEIQVLKQLTRERKLKKILII
jgi:hypothetical protein